MLRCAIGSSRLCCRHRCLVTNLRQPQSDVVVSGSMTRFFHCHPCTVAGNNNTFNDDTAAVFSNGKTYGVDTTLINSSIQRASMSTLQCVNEPSLRDGNAKSTMTMTSKHETGKRSHVFVSRHNKTLNVTANTILEYCNHHGLTRSAKTTSSHVILRECPFCPKPTGGKVSNLHKFYISIGGGAFFCHRCGIGGSWYDFKAKIGGYDHGEKLVNPGVSPNPNYGTALGGSGHLHHHTGGGAGRMQHDIPSAPPAPGTLPMPDKAMAGWYSSRLLDGQHEGNAVLQYLTENRGLTKKTLRIYGVGRAKYKFPSEQGYQEAECVSFPWIMRKSDVDMQEQVLRGEQYSYDGSNNMNQSNYFDPSKSSSSSKKKTSTTKTSASKSPNKDNGKTNKGKKTSDATTVGDGTKVAAEEETEGMSTLQSDEFVTRRIKVRALEQKGWQRLDPPGGGWGLFGLHTVPDDAREIVLTEGEYDAMAVYQATGRPAVSLPNGCRSLPVQVLPLLERFEKIYLWMDNDQPGQEGAETFSKKLGVNRCFIVRPPNDIKDANEALLKHSHSENEAESATDGEAENDTSNSTTTSTSLETFDLMQEWLNKADLIPHDRILRFSDLRSELMSEILEPKKYAGAPVPSLPQFTNLIKGFRRGELSVLTGPTGSGKTTFLSQVSLDLAEQGINLLWGSFEIKNSRLLHKLLKQFSRVALPDIQTTPNAKEKIEALADRFESLPLYFMRFHGSSEVDEVLDAMEYAVYVNDVEHIVLDNLQFMLSRQIQKKFNSSSSSFDKYEAQDIAIEKFRKFATEHNVHLTLVVHPRKEAEDTHLGISSFYGSAKATQEADNVMILQKSLKGGKCIDVKKNRFTGDLGRVQLSFHAPSTRYVEATMSSHPEKQQQTQGHYQDPRFGKKRSTPSSSSSQKKIDEPDHIVEDLENFWNECLEQKNATATDDAAETPDTTDTAKESVETTSDDIEAPPPPTMTTTTSTKE